MYFVGYFGNSNPIYKPSPLRIRFTFCLTCLDWYIIGLYCGDECSVIDVPIFPAGKTLSLLRSKQRDISILDKNGFGVSDMSTDGAAVTFFPLRSEQRLAANANEVFRTSTQLMPNCKTLCNDCCAMRCLLHSLFLMHEVLISISLSDQNRSSSFIHLVCSSNGTDWCSTNLTYNLGSAIFFVIWFLE